MVCDDHGVQYQSKCHFALAMCQGRISIKRKVKSCGSCRWIRVSYSKPKKTPQSIYFRKNGNGTGYEAQYKSLGIGSLLFFERTLNSWVIGIKNRTGTFVSMVQEEKVPFPQDSNGAMLVVIGLKGSTAILKTDPYFTIKCIKDFSRTTGPSSTTDPKASLLCKGDSDLFK
ncbi:uncharacterized protein LOC133184033 [Saccostrea echinata]|uniref:uncharacterized protein LOC133184033 n=1 Tax=Saccostrea echinata TaxID=191078 RepID=UPI002A84163B|nr:uncharacterized protein LOC133184033 [Saccostrea echinata]